jgi:FkbM family methyltransferase
LCIEPNPEYYKLVENIRQESVQCACGSTSGTQIPFTVFDIGQRNIMSSLSGLKPDPRLVKEHEEKNLINNSYEILVDVQTLDNILTEFSYPKKIDFISIDTEGTELDVLKGLDLFNWDISLLVVENNYNDPEIEEYLNACGYKKDARWKINDFYIKGGY